MSAPKLAAITLLACSLGQLSNALPYCDSRNDQPCLTSCSDPKFNDCPDFFVLIYDPKFCGLTKSGDWIDYTFECQACQNPDVVAVVGQKCSCEFTGCPLGQVCQLGTCVAPKISCASISCLQGTQCIDGVGCVPIEMANPCDLCQDYEICINNVCTDRCATIRCRAGYVCQKGTCNLVDPCAQVVCAQGQQCVEGLCSKRPTDPVIPNQCNGKCLDWERCFQGQCRDRCEFLRCANCFRGQCGVIDKCQVVKCKQGEKCVDGECVKHPIDPVIPVDQCNGKCLDWERCFQGQCRDRCEFLRCANCFRGQCGVIDKCQVVKCKQGEKCVDGECFKDNSCTDARKIHCSNPRPTQKNCPTLQFFREPDPVVCGVDKLGNRQDYPVTCYACRDTQNIFYYDVPCAQVDNQNKCGEFEQCINGECIEDPQFCHIDFSEEEQQPKQYANKKHYQKKW